MKNRTFESAPGLQEMVLKIVRKNPEGISLVDIGNQIGMNWRSLIEESKSLEERKEIERLVNLYYPVKKGKR